jgi:hypothetical protein
LATKLDASAFEVKQGLPSLPRSIHSQALKADCFWRDSDCLLVGFLININAYLTTIRND